jgi:hypothetical protein
MFSDKLCWKLGKPWQKFLVHKIWSVVMRTMPYTIEEIQLNLRISLRKRLEVLPHRAIDGSEGVFIAPQHQNGVLNGRNKRVWLRTWRTCNDGNKRVQSPFCICRLQDDLPQSTNMRL